VQRNRRIVDVNLVGRAGLADLLENLVELLECDRLADIAVGSQVITIEPVSLFVRGG